MAILHKNISASADIHVPKWLPSANNGDYAFKNEKGELESIDELLLPGALNFVDGSVAPPTTTTGDIYILSSGASVNAGWGSVALQDWVRYDGTAWNSLTPQKSSLCYDKTADSLKFFNGTAWATIGGGGGGTDANAVHVNVGSEISAITAKATPTTSDIILIEDAADSNNKKKITIGNLPVAAADTIYTADGTLSADRTVTLDGNYLSILGSTTNALRMLNNTDIFLNESTDGTGVNNMRLVSVLNQGRIELNNNFWKIHANATTNLFLGATGVTNKGSVTIETGVIVRTPGTVGATSLCGPEVRFYNRNLTSQWAKFDINGKFVFGANSFIGSEVYSIQGHTAIKGANTLSTSSALQIYDGDGTPNLLVNFKNNGTVNMSSLPTSSAGLSSGDIYNDSGTLKIV